MAPTSSAAKRAAAAPAAGPPAPPAAPPPVAFELLALSDDVIALVLSLLSPADRARMRRLSVRCNSTHAKAADALADQAAEERIGALVEARGSATVAANEFHTLCVRPADGVAFSCGGGYGNLHQLGQGQASGPAVRVPAPVAGLDAVSYTHLTLPTILLV